MQRQSKLKMMIAKLKLKELELIDRLSKRHDDYLIRVITHPTDFTILAINGDWEKVSGHTKEDTLGKNWLDFLVKEDKEDSDKEGFFKSTLSFLGKDKKPIEATAKSKYYDDINATVSICKVKKEKKLKKTKVDK